MKLFVKGEGRMVSKVVTIKNVAGLHAKPASLIAKKASEFKSIIEMECNGKKAAIKSLIGILSLRVLRGNTVKIIATGADEAAALEAVSRFVETVTD